jgi:hypothetical protein
MGRIRRDLGFCERRGCLETYDQARTSARAESGLASLDPREVESSASSSPVLTRAARFTLSPDVVLESWPSAAPTLSRP